MKKFCFLFALMATMALLAHADSILTVSDDVTYTVTNEGDYAWTEAAAGQMTSTNHAAGTTGSYLINFTCDYPVVFANNYSIDCYNSSNYGRLEYYFDEVLYTSYYGTKSGSFTYYIPAGTHTIEIRFTKTYNTSTTTTDCATFSDVKLKSVDSMIMTIENLTPGALGVEVLGMVSTLPDMQYLRIKAGTLNSDDWAALKKMTGLQYLDISGTDATAIPDNQFSGMGMKTIEFPTGLKSIGIQAFYNCMLRGEVVIPEGVENIGREAFYSSTTNRGAITKFTFPSTLKTWDYDLLRNQRSLVEADMNGVALATPSGLFWECYALTTLRGTENMGDIGQFTFYNCESLTDVGDLRPVTAGSHAFYRCITLPYIDLSRLTTAASNAFDMCYMLGNVDLSSLVSTSGSYAFANCDAMTAVTLPDCFTSFGSSDFADCDNLEEVTIGASVSSLSGNCFYTCPNIKRIYVNAPTPPAVGSNPFNAAIPTTATLYVPDYAMVSYKLDSYWSKFTHVEVNPHVVSQLSLSGSLELTSGVRIPGNPNMTMSEGSSFTINGDYSQSFNRVWFNSGIKEVNSNDAPCSLISRCANMTADEVRYSEYIRSGKWYFLCLPFDAAFDQIYTGNNTAFVIRYYDGQARSDNGVGHAWKDVVAGDTLRAGQGYIFRTQATCWLTAIATDETKNLPFRSDAAATPLVDYTGANEADNGWNLIGNPYPAYYDIWYMDYTSPITVWNENNSTYTAYSVADDNLALRPCQAFFAQKPTNVESITFQPLGRQHNTTIEHAASAAPRFRMGSSRLLVDLLLSNGTTEDRTRIVVNGERSDDYETECDASKMMSMESVPQLYTLRDDICYAINEGPQAEGTVTLAMTLPASGTYTLTAARKDCDIVLLDLALGKKSTLDTPYTFTADEGELTSRFLISLQGATAIDDMLLDETTDKNELYDLTGRRVAQPAQGVYIRDGKKVFIR